VARFDHKIMLGGDTGKERLDHLMAETQLRPTDAADQMMVRLGPSQFVASAPIFEQDRVEDGLFA
jgi:hypothetical protein